MRRWLLALLVVLLWAGGGGSASAAPSPAVTVVGVAGLRWDDVTADTPTLLRLAQTGAVGALSVKGLPAVTCPADGWLTLGAGARAEAYGVAHAPCDDALQVDLPAAQRRNAATRDAARLFAITAAGAATQGPGAALAAGPHGDPAAAVRIVDAGVIVDADRSRAASLRRADDAVAAAVADLPAGADLLLVGLSESPGIARLDDEPRLHVAIATGPSFHRGALRSASTRRAPYVQLIDLAPTVLALRGVPVPGVMAGLPWEVSGRAPTVAQLVDIDDRSGGQRLVTVSFFVVLIAGQLLLLLALRRRPAAMRLVALAGTAAPGASYLANLVPWWRAGQPFYAVLAVVGVLAIAAALAVRGSRHAVGWLATATAAVLVADLVTGARLQMSSVAGYSPLVAGRFAGIGNVAFGVYGAAFLLATASWAARSRRPAYVVAGAGVLAVAVDGAPMWGSDVGGVLALLPAFAVLGLLLTGRRVSLVRLAAAGLAGAAVVTAFALADYARPAADRTHLGRFVGQVTAGGAGQVLGRKAAAVFGLLFHSPVTAALPLVVALAVLLVVRPPAPLRRAFAAEPAYRHAVVAVGVLALVGFAVNDSGAAVVALALLLLAPATVAVTASAARSAVTAGAATPSAGPRDG